MIKAISKRAAVPAIAVGLSALLAVPAVAATLNSRTTGTGENIGVNWTEYDPDDLLGLPGNVHVGYLSVEDGPYGSYFYGNVTDFDCDPGEFPYGGHGGHVIVDEGADIATDAATDAIDAMIDAGQATLPAADIVDAVQAELTEEIPALIEEEFEEFPACDYIQDRFLEGDGSTELTVNTRQQTARITGNLTVTSAGHGGGTVLGRPPVDITITGGDWNSFEFSYSNRGANYRYSDSQKGTSYSGGTVTGGIGAMGFADDADDESYGYYSSYTYRTVERLR